MSNNGKNQFVTIITDGDVPPDELAQLPDEKQAALLKELLRQMARDNVVVLWDCRTSLTCPELLARLQDGIDKPQST